MNKYANIMAFRWCC